MKVHHLNCATMCPILSKLVVHRRGFLVCHVLVVETEGGLVLVDSGIGDATLAAARQKLGAPFLRFVGPRLDPAETARAQVEAMGFDRRDVRHIIVTHLDLDHAGGIEDFPDATIHVHTDELDAATRRASRKDRERYNVAQWAHGPRWSTFAAGGETWNGFEAVRGVGGLPPEILLVPVTGHTRGHTAVAVQGDDGGWLFHCGDAYFHRSEVHDGTGGQPFGLKLFEWINDADSRSRKQNVARLRQLAKEHPEVRLFCSHDPDELDEARAAATATSHRGARPRTPASSSAG